MKKSSSELVLLALAFLAPGCGEAPERIVAPPELPQLQVEVQAVTITGSSRQLTTDPATQFDPAISGNTVVYTDLRNGNADIYYWDLGANSEVRVTSSTTDEQLNDVSGNVIVYTRFDAGTGKGTIRSFTIGGTDAPVAADPTFDQMNPGIGGTIVAWEDRRAGQVDIWAKDLATGTVKQITNSAENEARPAVDGGRIAYQRRFADGTCQIFVTDFATLATTQVTTATGCHNLPDISGNTVVYDGTRAGEQDVFVYDLAAGRETCLALAGIQHNPNVSGDWVSFEDINSGVSVIKLYHVPSGMTFVAVSNSANNYMNDIDGNHIAYTTDLTDLNGAGNLDVFLYTFTVQIEPTAFPLTTGITSLQLKPSGAEKVQIDLDVTLDAASDGINPPGETVSLRLFNADGSQFYPTAFGDLVNGFVATTSGWSITDAAKTATGIQAFNINRTADPRTFTIHYVDTRTGLVQDPLYRSVSAKLTIGNDEGSSAAIAPRQQDNGDWVFP